MDCVDMRFAGKGKEVCAFWMEALGVGIEVIGEGVVVRVVSLKEGELGVMLPGEIAELVL